MRNEEDQIMKYYLLIFSLLISQRVFAQESVSFQFFELYNAYRKSLDLPLLSYSSELEEFADERLQVVTKETDHCYPIREWKSRCPTIDLHFKFTPMAQKRNKDTSKSIVVVAENMSAHSQCIEVGNRNNIKKKENKGLFAQITTCILSLFTTKEVVSKVNYGSENNEEYEYSIITNKRIDSNMIALEMFNSWKASKGHDSNFRLGRITHMAFKYCFVMHNGREYLHAVWIGGEAKSKK